MSAGLRGEDKKKQTQTHTKLLQETLCRIYALALRSAECTQSAGPTASITRLSLVCSNLPAIAHTQLSPARELALVEIKEAAGVLFSVHGKSPTH